MDGRILTLFWEPLYGIITESIFQKFGNLVPSAKYKQWEGILIVGV